MEDIILVKDVICVHLQCEENSDHVSVSPSFALDLYSVDGDKPNILGGKKSCPRTFP